MIIHDLILFASGLKRLFLNDGLCTIHNSDFRKDPLFMEAYRLGKATGSWGSRDIFWRAYVCCWAANSVKDKDGDFVECGVNKGGLARTVMHYVDFGSLDKTFWLYDTFNGIPEESLSDKEQALGIKAGGYRECYFETEQTFAYFGNVFLIAGVVPESFRGGFPEQVSCLSIDMNCVKPEIAAAEFFWPKMVSGGIIVLDDYGWKKHIHQKIAFDKFAKERNVQVLALPTGQGLIFKP